MGQESHAPLASLRAAHLSHSPRLRPPVRALTPAGPPRPTPWLSPAGERPNRSGIGRSGVEQKAEKRRGKRKGGGGRPPRSRGHPKGESRKNDRETWRGWGRKQRAAERASSRLLFQIASAHQR